LKQPEPNYKKALEVWLDKTEWVQETVKPYELGMHRADVLKQRIEAILAQPEQLREENERLHVENRRLIDRIETIGVPVGVGGFATTTMAQPEHDYKDLYEKEKRKSAMWLSKYEEIAGPAPKAIPMAQPEQEPVAWRAKNFYQNQEGWFYVDHLTDLIQPKFEPLYTTPPQRTWVTLTDGEFLKACQLAEDGNYLVAFQRIQQWLKEKNK
jgi:regulator of replication initiation timing